MNIIDAVIILFLLLGAVVGFKQGVLKKTVSFAGLLLIIILSFSLKNYVSVLMYENLPFFNFWGLLTGLEILNVILYELIAFLLVFSILFIIFKVVVAITGIVEKILKMTIILAIPSKLLGMVVGFLEYYIIAFVVLFILTQPIFHISILNDSKYKDFILNNTPIVSSYAKKTLKTYKETWDIIKKHDNDNTVDINTSLLEVMLKNKIITVDSTKKLIKKDKLHIKNQDIILNKYK